MVSPALRRRRGFGRGPLRTAVADSKGGDGSVLKSADSRPKSTGLRRLRGVRTELETTRGATVPAERTRSSSVAEQSRTGHLHGPP